MSETKNLKCMSMPGLFNCYLGGGLLSSCSMWAATVSATPCSWAWNIFTDYNMVARAIKGFIAACYMARATMLQCVYYTESYFIPLKVGSIYQFYNCLTGPFWMSKGHIGIYGHMGIYGPVMEQSDLKQSVWGIIITSITYKSEHVKLRSITYKSDYILVCTTSNVCGIN